jgi:GTP cyclohydrolase I
MPVDRAAAERALDAFLRAIGRDPSAEPELRDTAALVTAAYVDELCDGYAKDPVALLRAQVIPGSTGVVCLRDVAISTMCPHHLLPASGHATVAFAPRARLVGLGVLAEVLDAYARRLTLQEELGERVVAAVAEALDARWAACRLVLSHGCMTARGERTHGATVETLAFAGEATSRAEALAVVGCGR